MGTHLKAAVASGWSVKHFPLTLSRFQRALQYQRLGSGIFQEFSPLLISSFMMGKPGVKGSKGYNEKREKNNEAVRKSREKKREKEKLTMAELERVREENRRMEEQIHQLESNIEILKEGAVMK